ncbi:MAG: CapA family protein [Gemmatimonadetes bacterium]|nr:CapA family protein [Gemmatimonadota bacterium]
MHPTLAIRTATLASALVAALGSSSTAHAQAVAGGTMTFALTGDAIISRRLSPYKESEFIRLIEVIRSADVAFTNLEILFRTPGDGYPAAHSGGTWMTAEPVMAKELTWAGFDLVSRANNHTMDYMAGGLRSTSRVLDEAGLVHAGAGENLAEARSPAYIETAGGRVALISVASTFSDEDRAGPQRGDTRGRPGLSPLRYNTRYEVTGEAMNALREAGRAAGFTNLQDSDTMRFLGTQFVVGDEPGRHTSVNTMDMAQIVAVVRDAKRQADWVIVTSHSHESDGSREIPAEFLVEFTHAVVDAGADIFIGHGPHVMRGIEIYHGKPIFYSLANFIFQNETIRFLPGDMYERYGLDADALPGELQDTRIGSSRSGGFPGNPDYWESVVAVPQFTNGALVEIILHPVTLGHGKPRAQRGRPVLADDDAGRRIIERVRDLSRAFGVNVQYDERRNVGVIRP